MTAVAIHAVVHIAANTLVPRVRVRFGVAICALKHTVVARVGVAGRAHTIRMTVTGGKPCVIERRIQPAAGRVTSGAGVWKSCRDVVRIRCPVVIVGMAAVAVGRQRRVIVVHMATGAGHARVCAGERKAGVVVIERRLRPGGCVVANIALLRKSDRSVVRVIGIRVIREMAPNAGSIRQPVGVAPGVALAALQRGMSSREWPPGARVIERRLHPGGRVVANLALLGKAY